MSPETPKPPTENDPAAQDASANVVHGAFPPTRPQTPGEQGIHPAQGAAAEHLMTGAGDATEDCAGSTDESDADEQAFLALLMGEVPEGTPRWLGRQMLAKIKEAEGSQGEPSNGGTVLKFPRRDE